MISHKNAVFMVDNIEDVDIASGGVDYIFQVEPLGKVEKHDLNWGSEISYLIDEGFPIESKEIQNAAKNYWNGKPHPNESIWEYLTEEARIVDIIENEF